MIKFKLLQTCWACPEQYDVFLEGQQVGYLRLRNGYFRCQYPNCGGEIIFATFPKGDGMFEEEEREPIIEMAIAAIAKQLGLEEDFKYEIDEL